MKEKCNLCADIECLNIKDGRYVTLDFNGFKTTSFTRVPIEKCYTREAFASKEWQSRIYKIEPKQ